MRQTEDVPDHLLAHLSPLGWEHVNLTGDYIWSAEKVSPLRCLCRRAESTMVSSRYKLKADRPRIQIETGKRLVVLRQG